MEETLEDGWLQQFEKTDQLFCHFYKEDVCYVNLQFIYVNRENTIDKIKRQTFLMSTPNTITENEMFELLKRNSIEHDKRYSLLSILKYNIHLEPDEVDMYLQGQVSDASYLTLVKHLDNVTFEKTIHMFQDLNNLVFLLYEKKLIPSSSNVHGTKRVYISSRSKTLRKIYKD